VKIKKIFETTTQYMYIYIQILSVKHLVYLVDLSSFFPPGSHFTHSTPNPKAAPHLDGWAAHQSIVAGLLKVSVIVGTTLQQKHISIILVDFF